MKPVSICAPANRPETQCEASELEDQVRKIAGRLPKRLIATLDSKLAHIGIETSNELLAEFRPEISDEERGDFGLILWLYLELAKRSPAFDPDIHGLLD